MRRQFDPVYEKEDAKVNFASEGVPSKMVQVVQNSGYEAKTQKVLLPVQGMDCVSGSNRIRATLRQIPGVIAVNINFTTEKAAVEYILDQVTTKDLVKAIETAGFRI